MAWRAPLARGTREGTFILVSTLAVYLLLSLVSYSPDDPGWSQTRMNVPSRVPRAGGAGPENQ